MASIPPRSRLRSSCSSRQDRSTLETLMHMGFPKGRAEKAIAATGNKGTQLASEWLLSHVNDPDLDNMEPREYIMYLCPMGELHNRLMEFWDSTFQTCGWNSAHIYNPHITLCSFFKIPHNKVNVLSPVMDAVAEESSKWPCVGPLGLDLFTQSKNFIGYFVKSPHHQYIESLMIRVQQEFAKAGIEMKPQMKQLHMTLAFQYGPEHHDTLMKLAQELQNSQCSASWEVRVYSRDANLKTAEVRKIIKHYKPIQADELELNEGDFIYMEPDEHEHSPDGWFKGTSWRTGVSAFFPGNFTLKTSQMAVWTMHRSNPVPSLSCHTGVENGLGAVENTESLNKGDYDNVWTSSKNQEPDSLYAKVNKPKKNPVSEPRKMFIIRHAERCDFAFFRTWFDRSFDSEGRYIRFNLNCPKSLVPRPSYKDFKRDAPLTVIGMEEARITGDALKESGESITHIYCSPALRCVQTATEIMKPYGSHAKICIEPSLFEWCGWYKPNMPTFMTPEELASCGFPVNTSYVPYVKFENIKVYESVEEYYIRSYNFTQHILRRLKPDGGNLLMLGHSGTLDACTRQLRGKPPRNAEGLRDIIRGCPYCCICMAVEEASTGKWNICEPPIPQLTHGTNKDYLWESLLS